MSPSADGCYRPSGRTHSRSRGLPPHSRGLSRLPSTTPLRTQGLVSTVEGTRSDVGPRVLLLLDGHLRRLEAGLSPRLSTSRRVLAPAPHALRADAPVAVAVQVRVGTEGREVRIATRTDRTRTGGGGGVNFWRLLSSTRRPSVRSVSVGVRGK